MKLNKKFLVLLPIIIVLILLVTLFLAGCTNMPANAQNNTMIQTNQEKVDWFIPDGMRADPQIFNIYQWAQEGKLPNIKKMMDEGAYGYSIPTFPSHTPVNFATLLTGTYPYTHGVADGPMRIEGYPLEKPSVAGFSSSARKVPAFWTLEENAGKKVVLLSMPGSTPPELKYNGVTIRGRWGGWGADFSSLIFEKQSVDQRVKLARNARLFFLGLELTRFIAPVNDTWTQLPSKYKTYGNDVNLDLDVYDKKIYAKMIDTKDDNRQNYDEVLFSFDKKNITTALKEGEWSGWYPVTLQWKNELVESHVKFNIIKINDTGFFRIRVLVDSLNKFIVEPGDAATTLEKNVGPMVDFVDNFPPQLIYYPEDKQTFLQESQMSFDWHANAVDAIYKKFAPDVFIHDIYSPNQMLTSRWWMGYLDPQSTRYNDVSNQTRKKLWNETWQMYKNIDNIVGKILDNRDNDTLIILSSDHGAIPINREARLNNLFVKKGWLKYTINNETGEQKIDWNDSKVAFLKMDNVYINPNGLGPTWKRGSGPEYEKLRDEVIQAMVNLKDENGKRPLAAAVKSEDVKQFLDLPKDRVGDLVVAVNAGYGWSEDITNDGKIFSTPLASGYKQAIFAKNTKGLWTPFIIMGKGIKKGYQIKEPINHVDQLPTILHAMNQTIPSNVEGRVLNEIFVQQ